MEDTEVTTADVWMEAFDAHTHEEIEGGQLPHIHAPDCEWSVSIGLPIQLYHADELNVIEMMEFRALVQSMSASLLTGKQGTDLEAMTQAQRQFTVIAYNTDQLLAEALMDVTDKALQAAGISPPGQLQVIEGSSTIRSFGFVVVQDEDGTIAEAGVMYIAFKGGGLYRYTDVPGDVAAGMVQAASRGEYFHAVIKGVYEYKKVA